MCQLVRTGQQRPGRETQVLGREMIAEGFRNKD